MRHPNYDLTAREVEVLTAVARGLTNRQVGRELFIEVETVKQHLKRIGQKLDTNNRTEAAVAAIRRGLIT